MVAAAANQMPAAGALRPDAVIGKEVGDCSAAVAVGHDRDLDSRSVPQCGRCASSLGRASAVLDIELVDPTRCGLSWRRETVVRIATITALTRRLC